MLPAASRPRTPLHRHMPVMTVAALCLIALLAGCGTATGASLQKPGATAVPTSTTVLSPTPTMVPTPALTVRLASGPPVAGANATWRHANLPAGFGMAFHDSDLRVAASDGMTAYSCGGPATPSGLSRPQVIVTHDGGASWSRVSDIPGAWDGCQSLTVDELNPATVVACCGEANGYPQQAISTDGGASWRLVGGSPQSYMIGQLATRGSHTYAILAQQSNSGTSFTLGVSDDHLQTWHAIDGSLATSNYRALWVNRATGAVLLESWPGGIALQLWSTTDDGGHWSQLPVPVSGIVDFAVEQPVSKQPLHVCASYYTSTSATGVTFVCTSDGSRMWTQEPELSPSNNGTFLGIAGLPADGSLLAQDTTGRLYRLPAGGTRWQALGNLPPSSSGGLAYAATASGGMLWTFPAESDGASNPDSPTAVYSAAYPY